MGFSILFSPKGEPMESVEAWAGEPLVSASPGRARATKIFEGSETGRRFLLKHVSHGEGQGPKAEAMGLRLIGDTGSVPVPQVFGWDESRILMEWLDSVIPTPESEERFGHNLARLHTSDVSGFTIPEQTFCGPTRQHNEAWTDWRRFFWERRLCSLARRVEERFPEMVGVRAKLDKAWPRMEACVPSDVFPALVHGDLWSGNLVYGPSGGTLIDPAVYVGHHEVDLAMMRLFGGFSERVFAAYAEVRPLGQGWEERVPIYNLYHLLNHGILFGGGYLKSVNEELVRLIV